MRPRIAASRSGWRWIFPEKSTAVGCGLIAPEKPTLSAQILIVTSLLAVSSGEYAPDAAEPPWMVGSTLNAQPLVDGLAPPQPGGSAPWYANPSILPGDAAALPLLDGENSLRPGGIGPS